MPIQDALMTSQVEINMLLPIVLSIAIVFGITVFMQSTTLVAILVLNIGVGFSLFLAFTLGGIFSICLVVFPVVSLFLGVHLVTFPVTFPVFPVLFLL